MSKFSKACTAFVLVAFSHVGFACDKPSKPELPDPTTAVTPQMIKAKNDVKAYLKAAETYLECKITTKQHNRMVDEMRGVADSFNGIVRAYKARMAG